MDWDEVARFSAATVSLTAFITWLAKAIFIQLFNKDLEDHKSKLSADVETHKARLNAEIETHKAQLKKESDEYQSKMTHELARINNERAFIF